MPANFFDLDWDARKEALELAGSRSGRPTALLEKDAWVVWTLEQLFSGPDSHALVFKGGTSLSKAHRAIERFSEDVDVTYDIRALLGDRVGSGIPPSRKQADKWTDEVRTRLPFWLDGAVLPLLAKALDRSPVDVKLAHDGETVTLSYESAAEISYVKPIVRIEFGARSTGEPAQRLPIVCDAAEHLVAEEVLFPQTNPRVMAAERTFWEKATAMHVFCIRERFRDGDRYARHWYDVVKLEQSGHADKAIASVELGEEVAKHKSYFFREGDVDYFEAVRGGLRIVPAGEAATSLERDYQLMRDSNMFINVEPEPFQMILDKCQALQEKANKARSLVSANWSWTAKMTANSTRSADVSDVSGRREE